MKLNIAIVYHFFAHYRLPIFKELSNNETIDFTFLSGPSSENDIKTIDIELANIKVDDGGLRWVFLKNIWFKNQLFLWQGGLLRQVLKRDFDSFIFLGNIFYLSTWIAAIILKLKKKKFYFWSHGVTSDEKGLKWRIRSFFYNLSDGIFLYGHMAKQVMTKNGFPEDKLHVIYNSLDYTKSLQLRSEINSLDTSRIKKILFTNPHLPLIVFVGRLKAQKKLELLVEASKKLAKENFKINILFVGEGEATPILKKMVEASKIKSYFHFYGSCYDDSKLAHLIGASDICVSPGEVGLTAITSLSYGTPVISHDNFNFQGPEYESIIPKINGDLFIMDSVESLSEKIKQWVEVHKGISRNEIRKNCYKIIDEKYNPVNQANLINGILQKKS